MELPADDGDLEDRARARRGNTIVLKPSDTTPASTLLLGQVANEVLPPGVLNVVCGDRDPAAPSCPHQRPDMVAITGSVRAGSQVAEAAAANVKRVHLELGGKAPVIVFADADLAAAAEGIAGAGYYNAGQDCTAATRVLVHASVHDDFVAALAQAAKGQRTGVPSDPDVAFGPVNNALQLDRVTGFLDRLPDHASIVTGGHRWATPATSWKATVVSGLKQDDEAVQDEIFGPVITVQRFTGEDEAITLATACATGCPLGVDPEPRSGPARLPVRWTSAWCGSTPTSRSSRRCRTAGSSTPGTARTSRCTGSRTHPHQARDVRLRRLSRRIPGPNVPSVQHFRCVRVPGRRIPCWTPVCLRRSDDPPCSAAPSGT